MKNRNKVIILLMVGFIIITFTFAANLIVFAEVYHKVAATGTLTSVENDGSVIIDRRGYLVDPGARIMNYKGKSISLRSLSLPAKVNFEYEYRSTGFVITVIKKANRR